VTLYGSLEHLLSAEPVDIVDLCVPTHLHREMAIAALQAGKHVLVEKPMALSAADCEDMIAAATASDRLLMAGQVIRFWDSYQPLLEACRSGSLGALLSLHLSRHCAAPSWSAWLKQESLSGGGAFDLLIHDVDLCVHLLGLPQSVTASGPAGAAAGVDLLEAQLRYPGVASVSVSGGWHHEGAFPFSMGYRADFEQGTMVFDSSRGPAMLYRVSAEPETLASRGSDAFVAELAYFTECVASGRAAHRCRPEESADAVRVMRWLLESRTKRGRIVECGG
jgi:predicted dehydrogenase